MSFLRRVTALTSISGILCLACCHCDPTQHCVSFMTGSGISNTDFDKYKQHHKALRKKKKSIASIWIDSRGQLLYRDFNVICNNAILCFTCMKLYLYYNKCVSKKIIRPNNFISQAQLNSSRLNSTTCQVERSRVHKEAVLHARALHKSESHIVQQVK